MHLSGELNEEPQMITVWVLVYFLQNTQENGMGTELNLASFPTKQECEELKEKAQTKGGFECIGLNVLEQKPQKDTPITKWDKHWNRSWSEFKMDFWF